MLTSLTYCYAALGQLGLCGDTAIKSLELIPDEGMAIHHLWLAALKVIDADYQNAVGHFKQIDVDVINRSLSYSTLYQLVLCTIQAYEHGRLPGHDIYSQVIDRLQRICVKRHHAFASDPAFYRVYWLLNYRVAKDYKRRFAAFRQWQHAKSKPSRRSPESGTSPGGDWPWYVLSPPAQACPFSLSRSCSF